MTDKPQRVRMEEVDWSAVLPWTCLFRSFHMAISPAKLALALALILLTFAGGKLMDAVAGPRAHPQEITLHGQLSTEAYEAWKEKAAADRNRELSRALSIVEFNDQTGTLQDLLESDDRFDRAHALIDGYVRKRMAEIQKAYPDDAETQLQRLEQLRQYSGERHARIAAVEPIGVFEAAKRYKLDAFERFVAAAASLRFGFGDLIAPQLNDESVVAALRDVCVYLPSWLAAEHPVFLVVYVIWFLALLSLFGGAIARLAALDVARSSAMAGQEANDSGAVRFALRNITGYFLAPLLPVVVLAVVGLVMTVGGFILFNWPVLDVIGGVVFGLAIALGFVMALILVLYLAGVHLMFPAVAVEGADMFDAVSRAFGYIVGRPWRWLLYNVIAIVYGALTYLLIRTLVYLALRCVHAAVSVWVFTDLGDVSRFEAIMPEPQWSRLIYDFDTAPLGTSSSIAAWLVWIWVFLTALLVAAYAVTYYFCASTWVYLLLRRAVDGNELDDIHRDEAEA